METKNIQTFENYTSKDITEMNHPMDEEMKKCCEAMYESACNEGESCVEAYEYMCEMMNEMMEAYGNKCHEYLKEMMEK